MRVVDTVKQDGPAARVNVDDFNFVGQYDIGWLKEGTLKHVLDNMAASPRAFGGVRFFHALDSGTPAKTIDVDPLAGGTVWPQAATPPDFRATFSALEELTTRGLTPFVVLNFFPRAVSAHAATPPASFDTWKTLIRAFLDELVADPRFGTAVYDWYFEVWNEPNGWPFWRSAYDPTYFDLYRATSEAVIASGHNIRLGGPAIVYAPGSGGDMAAFLGFLNAEPHVKCDFISLHAKGSWTTNGDPEFDRAVSAVVETADLALSINRKRFANLKIINDEADMRVGFNIPYLARMDERFAAWMCALFIAYETLTVRYANVGVRFSAMSDNANQQLVQTSFDGRRALFTRASDAARDLIKLPIFNFYEVLRLAGDRYGACAGGAESVYPASDLFHSITVADSHVCAIFSIYPRTSAQLPHARVVDYAIADIPWPKVNVACFRIDAQHSNAYAAAGGAAHREPFPSAAEARAIRKAQELGVAAPIASGVDLAGGEFRDVVPIDPYAVVAYWITPFIPDGPADPQWTDVAVEDGNVILRWRPNTEAYFYSYEVYLVKPGAPAELLSPVPLRSAMWIDTAPPSGSRTYAVRAVSASGVVSNLVISPAIAVARP
ncbi:MAG: hypothetical protein WDA27_15365 [Actinomycetota bacterium]